MGGLSQFVRQCAYRFFVWGYFCILTTKTRCHCHCHCLPIETETVQSSARTESMRHDCRSRGCDGNDGSGSGSDCASGCGCGSKQHLKCERQQNNSACRTHRYTHAHTVEQPDRRVHWAKGDMSWVRVAFWAVVTLCAAIALLYMYINIIFIFVTFWLINNPWRIPLLLLFVAAAHDWWQANACHISDKKQSNLNKTQDDASRRNYLLLYCVHTVHYNLAGKSLFTIS